MNALVPIALSPASLPPLASNFFKGHFAGVTTLPNGQHVAVVLRGRAFKERNHVDAVKWAEQLGGVIPSHAVFNLVRANLASMLPPDWYWLAELHEDGSAWLCNSAGDQITDDPKGLAGAIAVLLIPIDFQ